MSEQEMV